MSLLVALSTALLAAAFVLAASEAALCWLGLPFSDGWVPSENALARFDRELGWSYVPELSLETTFDGRPVAVHTDARGARAPARGRALDPEAPSALFVGGSLTMGHGVSYEESFPGVLDADPAFPLQVVNLGVQAFGTDQALLQLRRHAGALATELVVYTFICDHLRRNANPDRRLLYPGGRFLGTKPRFALDGGGAPVLVDRPRRYEELAPRPRLWWLVRVVFEQRRPLPSPALTRALVASMRETARAHGARYAVLVWPTAFDEPACPAEPFAGMDVETVALAPEAPPAWSEWVLVDGHPGPRAHRFAAGVLLRELRARGLLGEPL